MTTTDFVPMPLDATTWDTIEPLVHELLARDVTNREELERWLIDRSELDAACSESQARLYIAMTCFTEDEAAQQAYGAFIEDVSPKLKQASFDLDTRQVKLESASALDADRYGVLSRDTRADVELFREKNIPLQTELAKLGQQADQIAGAMTVPFEGEERTLPQMMRELESTDRDRRERAWSAVSDRRLQDADAISEVYDGMVRLRHEVAVNAGHNDFVSYTFCAKHRFDYTREDCKRFHRTCEEAIVPLVRRLDEKRRAALGVEALRPWDLAVDVKGRAPLRPFEGGKDLVARTRGVFEQLDPRLVSMFDRLGDNAAQGCEGSSLDLDSRKGKAPGGYQYVLDRSRRPFIFMNAAGVHRDVETMVHEAGHAFHSMLCESDPLLHYREAPIEFAEVASMSMELLSMPHWDAYYENEDDLRRAQRQQLEGSFSMLPWIATIDAFQIWVYENPGHTRAERTAAWLDLDARFGHAVSWDGLESARGYQWQKQMHLFGVPLYYIEYGIAQLGALQLWARSLDEGPAAAIDAYIAAMTLGGSRPLPELFEAAGLTFDFGPETVGRLVQRVEHELATLPE